MKRLTATATATAFALATLFSGTAFAGPADDARTHFQAIGSGDLAALMRGYADNAHLTWVGGPLDGSYAGADAIRGVWEKFTKSLKPRAADDWHLLDKAIDKALAALRADTPNQADCKAAMGALLKAFDTLEGKA